jgi:hypothetical protein
MKTIVIMAIAVLLVGCDGIKKAEVVAAQAPAPVQITEPEAVANLRARAAELQLKWFIRCETDETDDSDNAFWGVAWPKGTEYATGIDNKSPVVPSWTVWGKSQEEVADKMFWALRFKPNSFPHEFHDSTSKGKHRKGFCPPEIRGE